VRSDDKHARRLISDRDLMFAIMIFKQRSVIAIVICVIVAIIDSCDYRCRRIVVS
jgi:hypothetical protein